MKRYIFFLLILTGILSCNRVPVRELSSTFKLQVQASREQSKAVKVDILWVVDDSASMCQEQASLGSSFHAFMNALNATGQIDPHIAVTTTNMCDKQIMINKKLVNNPDAIRGKFVYQPAKSFPLGCIKSQVKKCYSDTDCEQNWTCTGNVQPRNMYICDNPNETTDLKVKTINPRSSCVRRCDREAQPLMCTETFGESLNCKDLCKTGSCTVADCVAAGLGSDAECSKICSITNTCEVKCDMFFKDTTKCTQVCDLPEDQCFSGCAGQYNDKREWQKGVFDKDDVACGVICKADPTCDDLCSAQFGGRNVKCVYSGADKEASGCMSLPGTGICPKSLDAKFNILDNDVIDKWFNAWKKGTWVGDPTWKDLPDKVVRNKVFEQLFKCMATVGATQAICANQEMGLRAAFQALDPNGENSDQANAFLRDDAYLLVVIISDEDDCSTDKLLSGNDAPRCACLNDKNGCPDNPGAKCNPDKPGPLIPVSTIVNRVKSLKIDPAMVLFAAITGEPIPKSDVTPFDPQKEDETATLDRYYECKCANGYNQPLNYICKSNQGLSDFGSRYILASKSFNSHGAVSNICNDTGLDDALKNIVQRFSPIFARICLPRPMDLDDKIQVYVNNSKTPAIQVSDCQGHEDRNYYTLVKYSPGCLQVDVESGERLENAIAFCQTLDPNDSVEIRYRASSIGSTQADK